MSPDGRGKMWLFLFLDRFWSLKTATNSRKKGRLNTDKIRSRRRRVEERFLLCGHRGLLNACAPIQDSSLGDQN